MTASAHPEYPDHTQPQTQTFCVSFGVKYATEPHPTLPQAHPDGVLEIVVVGDVAKSAAYLYARRIAFGLLSPDLESASAYSHMYEQPSKHLLEDFPRGAIATVEFTIPKGS